MSEDETFVGRWAKRKEAAKPDRTAALEADDPTAAEPTIPEDDAGTREPVDGADVAPEDLPDIDTLDETSDYSVFMGDGVPDDLRNRALRKLWLNNPVFSVIDGLDEYDEDFTDAALAVQGKLKSAYQVGRGYAKEIAEESSQTPGPEAEDITAPVAGGSADDAGVAAAQESDDKERSVAENEAPARDDGEAGESAPAEDMDETDPEEPNSA